MYSNDVIKEVASAGVLGTGVIVLPQTSGSNLGTVLAITAISIGAAALILQIAIRLMRRYYNK